MPAGFHYVCILVSLENPSRHYVGITSDLKARLEKHNEGGCPHTAKYRPWRIETAIAFETTLKSGSGREFSRRHF